MIHIFLLITLCFSPALLSDGEQFVSPSPEQPVDMLVPAKAYTTVPFRFTKLMSNIRSAAPYSAAAKAKAIGLFIDLYEESDDIIKEILADLTDKLEHLVDVRFIFPSNKEKIMLLLLDETRRKLQAALKNQPAIKIQLLRIQPSKLTTAIYTAISPTLGDFWRKVRVSIALGTGALATWYIVQKIRQLNAKAEALSTAIGSPEQADSPAAVGLALAKETTKTLQTINRKGPIPTKPEDTNMLDRLMLVVENASHPYDPDNKKETIINTFLHKLPDVVTGGPPSATPGPFKILMNILYGIYEEGKEGKTVIKDSLKAFVAIAPDPSKPKSEGPSGFDAMCRALASDPKRLEELLKTFGLLVENLDEHLREAHDIADRAHDIVSAESSFLNMLKAVAELANKFKS
ncbi:MAG: hypothetical protein QG604_555 [Candidatus Dependentiae bacterium]|nr:hypothetical protein [Candidatus Dependentiae bacterium]